MALSRGSKGFLVVLVLLGVLVGVGLSWLLGEEDDAVEEPRTVEFEVPEGAVAGEVADALEEAGVIRSAMAFRLAARFDDRASQLRPGSYELEVGMDSDQILEILSSAPPPAETFRVTIPEGLTVDQTIERLAASSELSEAAFEEALADVPIPAWVPVERLPEGAQLYEGLLFPDTYEFLADATAAEILADLVAQTEAILEQVQPPEGMSPYDVLIVASLIEREARLREEQPVISSVIHNRLARPMRLQIDATVQYARGEHTERVLFEDLEIDSPWNTYRVDGLPPTPIAGAGRGAISAAAEPADTDYLFYVVSDPETGAHAFAETQAEHDANVAEYRRQTEPGGDGG